MKLTWILVADGVRARFFAASTPSSPLDEFDDMTHTEGRLHDREITSDLPGKIKSSDGSGHAFEQASDPKKHEEDHFAHQVAQRLEAAFNLNKFEQLLIISEPSFLGMLRKHLSEKVKRQVCFELDKSIANRTAEDIRKHLPDFLPSL